MSGVESAKFTWNAVKGPFAATIMTVKRLGWTFSNAAVLRTDLDEEIDLTRDSPAFVKCQITAAVKRKIAREIDDILPMLKSYGRGPITKGLRRASKTSKKLNSIHPSWEDTCASQLRTAVCNGQWTNSRLHRAGLTSNKDCKLCNAAIGSLERRHHCTRTSAARGKCIADNECDDFLRQLRPEARHLLMTRAMLAMPNLGAHAPNAESTFNWEVRPEDGVIDAGSTIYTD